MADKTFLKSYQYFTICNTITLVYSLAKFLTAPVFAIMTSSEQVQLYWWLICLFSVSMLQFLHYRKIYMLAKNVTVFINLASQLNHSTIINKVDDGIVQPESIEQRVHDTIDFTNLQQTDIDDRKIKLLSLEIKYLMQKQTSFLYYAGKVQFALYQIIHIWGFAIFLAQYYQDATPGKYLVVILVLGTYQYLQFYILVLLIIAIAPFILIWHLIKVLRVYKNKRDALRVLREQNYSEHLPGDHQCKICMADYQLEDRIVMLSCSPMHHFHTVCIKTWVQVSPSPTCPVCRKQIGPT